jgi:hypothetical protein
VLPLQSFEIREDPSYERVDSVLGNWQDTRKAQIPSCLLQTLELDILTLRVHSCLQFAARHISLLLLINDTSKLLIHSSTVVPSANTAPKGRVDQVARGTAKKACFDTLTISCLDVPPAHSPDDK